MIPVTKPYLPSREKYKLYIDGIWERDWLTNNGPLVLELESRLKKVLGLNNLLYVSNGTIALQMAIKALKLSGDVITTPFSYVATTSSLVWEGCNPIYVDIDGETLNIDPQRIEEAITEKTTGILATHCFGNACDIDSIQSIASKYDLKVIYDAAHCFGTKYKGLSILEYGDISTLSLHATKLVHSAEGGGVVTKDSSIHRKLAYLRNFGHDGPDRFNGFGINAKNSELHAAMGLSVLDDAEFILQVRKSQVNYYDEIFSSLKLRRQRILDQCEWNYSYYPVIFANEQLALRVKNALEKQNIFPRRYFYPSLSSLDYVNKNQTPVSDHVAASILCLPLYHHLTQHEQNRVAVVLKEALED